MRIGIAFRGEYSFSYFGKTNLQAVQRPSSVSLPHWSQGFASTSIVLPLAPLVVSDFESRYPVLLFFLGGEVGFVFDFDFVFVAALATGRFFFGWAFLDGLTGSALLVFLGLARL